MRIKTKEDLLGILPIRGFPLKDKSHDHIEYLHNCRVCNNGQ